MGATPRAVLEGVLHAALESCDAGKATARALAAPDSRAAACLASERLWVLALGKAAVPMAEAAADAAGPRLAGGLVVAPDGHGSAVHGLPVRHAGHPLPDARSERAARETLALVAAAGPEDALLVLLSGGASALLSCPAPGLALDELAAATRALLHSGAAIDELNTVRKHLGATAGGRLARAAACRRIAVLAVSDVPGDRIDVIASGPFAPDPTTFADALAVVEGRRLRDALPAAVLSHLCAGARGDRDETPKPGDRDLTRVATQIIASNATARAAAATAAAAAGLHPVALRGCLEGEARVLGRRLAALGLAVRGPGPLCLIGGGETTVSVRGDGRGGRNQELALAAAIGLDGREGVSLLAAGTDGTDGPTDAAGAFADGGSVARAGRRGVAASDCLARNDSYAFFAAEGGVLRTGPTRTNVMDLVLVRVEGNSRPGQ